MIDNVRPSATADFIPAISPERVMTACQIYSSKLTSMCITPSLSIDYRLRFGL